MFLVMGITGNVGGATAGHLLAQGKKVRALVRDREKALSWANQGVELVDGDWNDPAAIERSDGIVVHRVFMPFRVSQFDAKWIAVVDVPTSTINEALHRQFFAMLIASLGVVALLVSVGWFISKTVANPIKELAKNMGALAKGELSVEIGNRQRQDEIGEMALALHVFKDNELRAREIECRAEADRKSGEFEHARIAELERLRAEDMTHVTTSLAAGLKGLSSGDLGFQLNSPFAEEFEPLRHHFNQSVTQLGTALRQISESIATMDNGTQEIAAGANDLSRRTEQQAASLEETAAALDEITANVSNSAKRTEEARHLATQANHSAIESAQVVALAEEAMRKIESSSVQISNIIGVIDEIAFQTNLLALNAGVEAARAGEAGKGFAVVAQEVRELAQRSAQAAKEIKALIHNSSGEVESGVKLVRDTGETLNTIGDFIRQIHAHVEVVSTSAREQSTGLLEVNSAVNSMDQTTQQNAAMVEEATAAAASLAQEAQTLRELVSILN
ncbi:HAMP domain-containing protein [Rhizobium leguminosarum]|nr:HAMP domain-containing protein [Rhizobium leguminosarum]